MKNERNETDWKKVVKIAVLCAVIALALFLIIRGGVRHHAKVVEQQKIAEAEYRAERVAATEPELDVELLSFNEYSRPGLALEEINGIVIHYTANPGTSAIANRNYFEGLKDTHATKASAHFIVGLEGEIVQCIPTSEIAYASNTRNMDTVAIECCYGNEDGSFEQATYDSVIYLTAWLCAREGLTSEQVLRHYDITGKPCPLYYAEHPEAWEQFRADVDTCIGEILGY